MNCDRSTAPVRPPPGPGVSPPGLGEFGPGCSLQQAEASSDSASSNVTMSRLPSAQAGEPLIFGIQLLRNLSATSRPQSWAWLHGLGVMNTKLGGVAAAWGPGGSRERAPTLRSREPESSSEWKYTNGSCLAA